MDRLPDGAAFAAMVLSLMLSACGGDGSSADAVTPPSPSPQAVDGVTTPSSVSVVTAKNAQ
jgi:hypothetical protein